jgi:hypothetical protein
LQQGRIGGHARTWNDQVLFKKCIFPVAAQFQVHTRSAERRKRFANFIFRSRVRRRNVCATRGAKKRGGHTGPRQSHDQHAFASQLERIRHVFRKTS